MDQDRRTIPIPGFHWDDDTLQACQLRTKNETAEPVNTIIVYTCEDLLVLVMLRELEPGAEMFLQKTLWPKYPTRPGIVVYACACGLNPCCPSRPRMLRDRPGLPHITMANLMRGGDRATLPRIFALLRD